MKTKLVLALLCLCVHVGAVNQWVYGVSVADNHWHTDDGMYSLGYATIPTSYRSMFNQITYYNQNGWYDVNKRSMNPASTTPDNLLCWAVSASNLLQWFVDKNAAYISDTAHIPQGYSPVIQPRGGQLHTSRIYDDFVANFVNDGAKAYMGLMWYLTGFVHDNLSYNTQATPLTGAATYATRGGYLLTRMQTVDGSSVETALDNLITVYNYEWEPWETHDYYADFQTDLKNSLAAHQALAISVPGHALTVWGAEISESDTVTALYIADSDDNSFNGIVKCALLKGEGDVQGYAVLDYANLADQAIGTLMTLDLGVGKFRLAGAATSNNISQNAAMKVWAESATICIQNPINEIVSVYSVSGQLMRQITCIAQQTHMCQLPQGIYIIKGSHGCVKVAVP